MYLNVNNPVNYQLQGFGQNGVRTISTDQLYIQGEYYRVLVAEEDSYVTAVSVLGDDLTAEFVYAGTTIYGLFTEVSVSSGSLTAYIAGPTDIEDVWAYINAYGQTNAARIEAADCAKDAIAPLLDKYYAKASLVMVPSLYKTSIVYSERPLTSSGQLAFTRSNDTATRVNSAGLIEKVRTNLMTYSEDWTNAAWTKTNATVTANATTNPIDGATTADAIFETTTNGQHNFFQVFTAVVGTEVTISFYAKANGRTKLRMNNGSSALTAAFDLSAVTASMLAGTGTPTITSVDSGWYRCSITYNALQTTEYVAMNFRDDSNQDTYAGDITKGMFFFGAQAETGVLTNYIPTTAAAVSVGPVANLPRLNYPINSDGSVGCPSLLLEPQRTNLATYSEQFDNADWAKSNTSITKNTSVSPDGYTNADKLISSSDLNAHVISSATILGIASIYTASCFIKKSEYNYALIRLIVNGATDRYSVLINLTNGNVENTYTIGTPLNTSYKIDAYGNGWYRLSVSAYNSSGNVQITISSSPTANPTMVVGSGVPIFNSDNSSGIFIYGAQLEAGAYATSYIPTLGASVTRGADACSKTGISSLIGQTEGAVYFEGTIEGLGATNRRIVSLSDGTNANTAVVLNALNTLNLEFALATSSVTQASITASNAFTLGQTFKFAFAYANNDFVFYVNGVQIGVDGSGTLPASLTNLVFGRGPLDFLFEGKVAQALLFKTRLTNQELQDLTTL